MIVKIKFTKQHKYTAKSLLLTHKCIIVGKRKQTIITIQSTKTALSKTFFSNIIKYIVDTYKQDIKIFNQNFLNKEKSRNKPGFYKQITYTIIFSYE